MIYCISGLGATQEMFSRLDSSLEFTFLPWLEPEPEESLQDYAKRMAKDIDFSQPADLIGYSFGGMVAQEIAAVYPVRKLILVSSATQDTDLDHFLALGRKLKMHHLVGTAFIRDMLSPFTVPYFQPISTEDIPVLRRQMAASSWALTKWSMDRVLEWKPASYQALMTRIHGTHDKMFPLKPEAHPEIHWVKGGGHFMLYNRAEEVGDLIKAALQADQG